MEKEVKLLRNLRESKSSGKFEPSYGRGTYVTTYKAKVLSVWQRNELAYGEFPVGAVVASKAQYTKHRGNMSSDLRDRQDECEVVYDFLSIGGLKDGKFISIEDDVASLYGDRRYKTKKAAEKFAMSRGFVAVSLDGVPDEYTFSECTF